MLKLQPEEEKDPSNPEIRQIPHFIPNLKLVKIHYINPQYIYFTPLE